MPYFDLVQQAAEAVVLAEAMRQIVVRLLRRGSSDDETNDRG